MFAKQSTPVLFPGRAIDLNWMQVSKVVRKTTRATRWKVRIIVDPVESWMQSSERLSLPLIPARAASQSALCPPRASRLHITFIYTLSAMHNSCTLCRTRAQFMMYNRCSLGATTLQFFSSAGKSVCHTCLTVCSLHCAGLKSTFHRAGLCTRALSKLRVVDQ